MKENKEAFKRGRGGRPRKTDTATACVMVRFTNTEYARFLTLFEQSGLQAKATFIKARVFNESFRVIKTDRAALEYVAKLTTFYAQFRAVGVNYNQTVKEMHIHFSEKKALALLYKLEKLTTELVVIGQQIIALTKEMDSKWSGK